MPLILLLPEPAVAEMAIGSSHIIGLTPQCLLDDLDAYRAVAAATPIANAVLVESADPDGDLLAWTIDAVKQELLVSDEALQDLLRVTDIPILAPNTALKTGCGASACDLVAGSAQQWIWLAPEDELTPLSGPRDTDAAWLDCRRPFCLEVMRELLPDAKFPKLRLR